MGYSFIIPVYNCRETLSACVESIRAAKLGKYEILLIDDGSEDGSGELCDRLAETYSEIRAAHQEHAGVSAARNFGLRVARHEHILFADGDDTLDGPALRLALEGEGDLLIFGAEDPGDWRQHFEELFWANVWSPVWNKVYKKRIIQEYSLEFREEMFLYEDLEFVLRYLACCERVVFAPEKAYGHRPSGGASRRIRQLGQISAYLHPLEEALQGLRLPGETKIAVRVGLYQILAREKIRGANLRETKEICRDFQGWYEENMKTTQFTQKLLEGWAVGLWLESRLAALRHRIRGRIGR